MPKLIEQASRITAAGNKPKLIDEFIGRANSDEARLSVAHMRSPGGWIEPGQRPDFDEFTLVLQGTLRVQHEKGSMDVRAGQAVVTNKGEWVRYSTPFPEGAEYIAVAGMKETLRNHKPLLLIEVHTIFNMLKVSEMLRDADYSIELASRCGASGRDAGHRRLQA